MPGWRRFLTLEQPDAEVTVEVAGARKVVRSDEAGHVDATVEVALPPGRATARLRTGQSPSVPAPVYVASPAAPRGVVCDIDDTVWVTGLRYPVRAAWRTFVEAGSGRRPVPGMATLLRGLVRGGADAPVIYLSTGPWNLAGAVIQFLQRHGFPSGALLMTDWGFTPRGWFRDGRAHKRDALARLAGDLPDVRWVLVGDDGRHDPEIYAEFARRFPERVAAIALRQVAPGARLLDRVLPLPGPLPTSMPVSVDAGAVPVVRAAAGERLPQLLEPHLAEDGVAWGEYGPREGPGGHFDQRPVPPSQRPRANPGTNAACSRRV